MRPLVLFGDTHLFPKSVLFKAAAGRFEWIDGNRLVEPVDGELMAWEKFCEHRVRKAFGHAIPRHEMMLNEYFQSDKAYIEQVHLDVFGYSAGIDPLTFRGVGVVKSRRNARHDGRVVQFPISKPDPRKVYQKLIDNELHVLRRQDYRGEVEDIRLCTLRGKPIVCYLKRRLTASRFLNANTSAYLVMDVRDVLSAEELALIAAFCKAAYFDYGGLDILRDRKTMKIYIVDANNTPRGPPKELLGAEKEYALARIGDAFVELLSD